ncbi:MAG: hypothetical protein ACI8Y7_000593 [Candidatus Woesearchaeota archaeon]|jgi:hypothetical protein
MGRNSKKMGYDMHALVGKNAAGMDYLPFQVQNFLELHNLHGLVVPVDAAYNRNLAPLVNDYSRIKGAYMTALVNSASFRGTVISKPTPIKEFKRMYASQKELVCGIKVHTSIAQTAANDVRLFPFYNFAAETNLPVLIHGCDKRSDGYTTLEVYDSLLEQFPDTTFVLSHLGGLHTGVKDTLALAGDYANVYFTVTGVTHKHGGESDAEQVTRMNGFKSALEWSVNDVRRDRVLFGSDFPFLTDRLLEPLDWIFSKKWAATTKQVFPILK